MGKISYKDIDNYSSSESNTNFFTLSNDGDSAIVRILADSIDDVFITPVHENVDVDGVQRKVNCLRKVIMESSNLSCCFHFILIGLTCCISIFQYCLKV